MIILHVDSSITAENSVTRAIGEAAIARLSALYPDAEIRRRDLVQDPLGHMTLGDLGDTSHAVEFLAADIVVIGAPMYNFSIPSSLKAWMDRLAIAGTTFRYGETGVEGLAGGRKLIIASARGGFYGSDTGQAWLDHQETYLRGFFGFLGVTDIDFVRAEGVAISPDARATALEKARIEATAIAA
jgi:FMN-dependent NADH-azoreductase